MTDSRTHYFPISDSTQVGESRRAGAQLAEEIGLDENAAGKVAILVTELANNLHKHAREGSLLLRTYQEQGVGIEVLATDKGPGMTDVEKCFQDGYSTSGTAGTGLGSIVRLADAWDVYSMFGVGTTLMARIGKKKDHQKTKLEFGSVCVPVKGEKLCGDSWAHATHLAHERVMVVDGLGHGPLAAEAADEATAIFAASNLASLPELMQAIHNALRKTRGAAAAIAELDFAHGVVRYVGVGNISATILNGGTTRSLVSQNGTVGHEVRKIQEFQYPWPEGSTLVMNSDGLVSKWDISKYPGLTHRHPSLLTGVLWRDFTRGRDDATVVAVRERKG
jgi:anti-sigma regulatory factor (Ser/Thr protein kinase)